MASAKREKSDKHDSPAKKATSAASCDAACASGSHPIVSDAEWLAARKELLQKEKELARAYEAVAKQRQKLPWHVVSGDYAFTRASDNARLTLRELFADKKKPLIMVHLMYEDAWDKPCPFCAFWADGYSGNLPHLQQRVNFVVSSKASAPKLAEIAKLKDWHFPFVSAAGSPFHRDIGAEFTSEEVESSAKVFNYGSTVPFSTQTPGVSVFVLGGDGKTVYHTYSTWSRGIEFLNITETFLDLTPEGRYDDHVFPHWVKHKEQY